MAIKRFLLASLCMTLCFVVTVSSTRVSAALNDYDKASVYGDWTSWVPDEADRSDTCILGNIALSGNGNIQQIYNFLTVTHGLTNIQAISLMANIQAESHFEPRLVEYGFPNSRGEISKAGSPTSLDDNVPPDAPGNTHGQPGYGLAQWSGGRKANLRTFAASKGVKGSDLAMQLEFLWNELSSSYNNSVLTPLKSTTGLNDGIELVLRKFEAPANIETHLPERIALGAALYLKYGGTAAPVAATTPATPASTITANNGCDVAANGNVVQTALSLAWDTGGHGKFETDAKPTYQVAMPKYNGSTGDDEFSDCGVFVSTVMVASGADTNYPKRGTSAQMTYLETSSKYQQVQTTNTADLKPGDIFITDGHTYMYVGGQSGGYNSVGGSLHDHVPEEAGNAFFSDSLHGVTRVYKVFRLKG